MPAAGFVTLILVLVAVAALAAALVRVAVLLKHVNFTLGTVIAGVRAIELATRPINPVLGDIANDLTATQTALDGLLAAKAAAAQPVPAQRAAAAAHRDGAQPAPSEGSDGTGPLLVSRLARRGGRG
jgi:hypothetical protein